MKSLNFITNFESEHAKGHFHYCIINKAPLPERDQEIGEGGTTTTLSPRQGHFHYCMVVMIIYVGAPIGSNDIFDKPGNNCDECGMPL